MLIFIFFLTFATAALIGYSLIPGLYNNIATVNARRANKFSMNVEQYLPGQKAKSVSRLLILAPVIFGFVGFFLFPEQGRLIGLFMGAVLGLVFPGVYIKWLKKHNQEKFADQLIDALMIMSSSFRGGLSLVQALEAVVEEMPEPIQKEFGTVLGENKMGVSLEEALNHLYNRMPSTAVQQMITAILLARETGGNLPAIFGRIVTNIRENKKIQQNINTLTIQGKIQGVVLTILPVAFGYIVYKSNRRIFDHMFTSDIGQMMLIYSFFSWLIGAFMVWKISTFKDF